MTLYLTILALAVAVWRIRRRLFTVAEWALLVLFVLHFLLTQLQVAVEGVSVVGIWGLFYVDWRYVNPAFFLSWGWLAWAVSQLWNRQWRIRGRVVAVRHVVLVLLSVMVVYGLRKTVRSNFPWVKRSWIVAACEHAADRINQDWKGPSRNATNEFWLSEYNSPLRPNVHGPSGRLAYLVNGCAVDKWPAESGPDKVPDYWLSSGLSWEDLPPPGLKFTCIDSFKCGKRDYKLYRREDK